MKPRLPLLRLSAIALLHFSLSPAAMAADPTAPPTAIAVVTDSYGTLKVDDPYRWLENAADPKVVAWSQAQDDHARAYFDKLPYRKAMFERLMAQASASSPSYYDLVPAGGKLFAFYNQPPKQQPMIAELGADADPARARVVLDPNQLNPKGTTAIDWFVPSPDCKLLAVSMSENGSEDGSLHLVDAVTGKEVGPVIPRVQYPTGGGSVAWAADGRGFWYTRYPGPEAPAERQHFYQQIYFHKLGEPIAKDKYVLGKDFPKVAEIMLSGRAGVRSIVASVANGDGGEFAQYLVHPDGKSQQISTYADKVIAVSIGDDQALYLTSRLDAPRGKLLKLPMATPQLSKATLLVPESDAVIEPPDQGSAQSVVVTPKAIYVRQLVGGPSQVMIYGHDGKAQGKLPLPDVAAVDEIAALPDGSLLYGVRTYLAPRYIARYSEGSGTASATKLAQTSPVSFDDAEVVREFATSKDGTKVPLNILRRKGVKLDGKNPLLLTGYGGYNVSMKPAFAGANARLWLDGGGVMVVANLRGGGEFGDAWHEQGMLTRKQNVFDDFIASADYLTAKGYTSAPHLAILGGSNGGLLMGAVTTQRPELFRAVVSNVGIYDMLRVELDPNGAFNVTEFGSVKNPDQLATLAAYSPYQYVQDGARYPAVFMATGATDGRVNPMHSRKMIARLQAATASGQPIYLSINQHAGHGMGSALSIRISQAADQYSFLFDQLGMRYPQP